MKIKKTVFSPLFILPILLIFYTTAGAVHILTPAEQLGKAIFFDKNLSIKKNQACASCHDPVTGWTGPDTEVNAHGAVYMGSITGRFGDRKPPSAAYAAVSPILHYDRREELFIGGNFWDGRATGEELGNLKLTDKEEESIVTFMKTLSDGFVLEKN